MPQVHRILAMLLLLIPLLGYTQEEVIPDKFAIAAEGNQPTSEIARLVGVAPFFHIYDSNGNLLEILDNPHLDLEWGIGPAVAGTLGDMGVSVLVAQRIPGPKMEDALIARKIRIVRRVGTVQDVVDELKE